MKHARNYCNLFKSSNMTLLLGKRIELYYYDIISRKMRVWCYIAPKVKEKRRNIYEEL